MAPRTGLRLKQQVPQGSQNFPPCVTPKQIFCIIAERRPPVNGESDYRAIIFVQRGQLWIGGNLVEEQGFAIVPDVLTDEDLAALLKEFSRNDLTRSRAGVRHAMKRPAVSALAHDIRVLKVAREVLGTHALPFRATLFDKSASANWLVVWHQDTALPLRERREVPGWGPWSIKEGLNYSHAPAKALEQVLALRVHLDDSTGENGPLRVLPGTHSSGILTDDAIH